MSHVHPVFENILARFYHRRSVLSAHETVMVCPMCGEAMRYEPSDPRDEDRGDVGILGCSDCGHGEPVENVREYEAAKTAHDDD
jgi:translation initiation factor 2 beta subunit (eIF-2beta)/eIF-5